MAQTPPELEALERLLEDKQRLQLFIMGNGIKASADLNPVSTIIDAYLDATNQAVHRAAETAAGWSERLQAFIKEHNITDRGDPVETVLDGYCRLLESYRKLKRGSEATVFSGDHVHVYDSDNGYRVRLVGQPQYVLRCACGAETSVDACVVRTM